MKFSKPFTISCCLFMSTIMSDIPAMAVAAPAMMGTQKLIEKLDRAQAQNDVENFLKREDVKQALLDRGVSPDEVSSRLASLSESEMRQLAGQVHEARAGGDLLVTILLIVLIIFLVKRI